MKEVVTKDNYKQIVLKRMKTLCWALLIVCFVIKLFGGNFFAFVGESEVAEYVEKHFWLLTLVQFPFYFFSTYITYMIILKDKHKLLSAILTIVLFVFKVLSWSGILPMYISTIIEVVGAIIVPIILNRSIWEVLIVQALLIVFQAISLFTKSIGLVSFPDTTVVGYVYMIDYYILLLLTYLDFKEGGFNIVGRLGLWFLSKDKEQLEAYKEVVTKKHNKKVDKYNKKIDKIDEKIAKC